MLKKFLIISLCIHLLFFAWTFFLKEKRRPQSIVQHGVEINVTKIESHYEKKDSRKKEIKPKLYDVASNTLENEESLQQVEEKASGRDDTLISQYASLVAKNIDSKKYYPIIAKKLKQEGIVVLNITIGKNGKVLALSIKNAANYQALNEASFQTVKKIEVFPPIPEELSLEQITFSIPMEYKIL